MKEKAIDAKFVKWCKANGITTVKLSALGRYGTSGWPDRMCLKLGRVAFAEMKAPGRKLTALQEKRIIWLHDSGFFAFVYTGQEDLDSILGNNLHTAVLTAELRRKTREQYRSFVRTK